MKKTLAAIMALVIALSCLMGFGATALAANEPSGDYTVSFDKQEAHKTDEVVMEIGIKNNPGLITLRFQIRYDQEALTLVKVEDKQLLKGWTQPAPTIKSPYILRWADSLSTVNHYDNGTVARVTFKVNDGAKFEKTMVTIEHIESRQTDGAKVFFTNASAELNVVCQHPETKEEVAKQPTHTDAGAKNIVCAVCGETIRTESIPALGHTYGEWAVKTAPTCTEKGVEERSCSCGATETREVAAKGHTPGEWVVTTAPTCTEKGVETQKCAVCGADMGTREVPAKGHTAGEWKIVKEATCTEAGEKTSTCTVCNEAFTEEIPALGHKADKWEIVKDATCAEDGEKKAVCTVCEEEFTEVIPALGHTFSEWKVVKEATEAEEGMKERVCSVCGETEKEILPKLTVTPDADTPKIPATGGEAVAYSVAALLVAMSIAIGVGIVVTQNKKRKVQ